MSLPDHYATLGLSPSATGAEIQAARRRCLRERHPDAARGDAEAARRATEAVLLAGEVLLDPGARAAYDKALLRSRTDARFKSPPPERPREGMRDLWCPSCRHLNVETKLHYCIYCGGGIGPTPRPVRVKVTIERRGLSAGMSTGCGLLLGGTVGGIVALRLWFWGDLTALGVALVAGLPAVIVGLLALVYRERFWDRLTGFFSN